MELSVYNKPDAARIFDQAEHRVEVTAQGGNLHVVYLASLSSDIVPVLMKLDQSPALTSRLPEVVGAALVCVQKFFAGLRGVKVKEGRRNKRKDQ